MPGGGPPLRAPRRWVVQNRFLCSLPPQMAKGGPVSGLPPQGETDGRRVYVPRATAGPLAVGVREESHVALVGFPASARRRGA